MDAMNGRAFLLASLLFGLSGSAAACYCQSQDKFVKRLESGGFPKQFTKVFHGRVTRVYTSTRAEAQVLETFKGKTAPIQALGTGHDDCSVTFTPGEEYIYLTVGQGGVVQCWLLAATPAMLEKMRRVAATPPSP